MVSHPACTFSIAVFPIPTRLSQFAATVDASPAVPARISPRPTGTLPDSRASIPRAREAPLIKAVTFPIGPFNFSIRKSQLMEMAATLTPAIIMGIPISGCPANANTAPIPREAPPTIDAIAFTFSSIVSPMVFHAMVTEPSPVDNAPIIKPMPRDIFPPEKASIAPTANPPANAASTAAIACFTSVLIPSQFATIALVIDAAPEASKPRPNGMFAPVNKRIAPRASSAPPTIMVILERVSCSAVCTACDICARPPLNSV